MPRLSSSPTRARFATCCRLSTIIAQRDQQRDRGGLPELVRLARMDGQDFSASRRNRFSLLCNVLTCHAQYFGRSRLVVACVRQRQLDEAAARLRPPSCRASARPPEWTGAAAPTGRPADGRFRRTRPGSG